MTDTVNSASRVTYHAARAMYHAPRQLLSTISELAALTTLATLAWQRDWPLDLPGFDTASVPFPHNLPAARLVELTAIAAIVAYALSGWPNLKRLTQGMQRMFTVSLIGLWLITALSPLWAIHRGLAVVHAAHTTIWVAFALMIACSDWSSARMAAFFLGGLLIQVAVGLVQVALQHFVGLGPRLGELPVRPQDNWVSVVFNGPVRWLRAYGLSGHPNVLGGHLAVGSILTCGLVITWPKVWRALIVIAWTLIWVLLLLTFSRSAWLALIVGGLTAAVLMVRGRNLDRRAIIAAITLLILAVMIALIFIIVFLPFLINRVDTVSNSYETFSINERSAMINWAVQLIVEHPLTGVGAANYGVAVRTFLGYPLDWVHNVPLLIGSELGLPALFMFTLMIGSIAAIGVRRWRTRSISMWPALLGGTLAGLMTIMLFDHYLWTAPQGTLLWAWLSGWWMREQ